MLYTNRAESSPVVGGAYKHHNITKNSTLFDILFMINGEYNKGVGEFVSLWVYTNTKLKGILHNSFPFIQTSKDK